MKKYFTLILITVLLFGCDISNCGDMLYETGPPLIHIELIDKDSEENIFTKELFTSEDIQIIDVDGNSIEYSFIDENNYNIISTTPYRYDSQNTIFIKLGEEIDIELTFDVKKYESECSSSFFIENLEVENYPYEIDNQSGILKIKV